MVIYAPTLLALDTRVLMAVYNNNKTARESNHPERPAMISNLVEIKFIENTYVVQANNGAYSMLLKIEFTPDMVPSKTEYTRPGIQTIKQAPEQTPVKPAIKQ